jgi:hypothetical protein
MAGETECLVLVYLREYNCRTEELYNYLELPEV